MKKEIQNIIFDVLVKNKSLKEFEKYVYSFSFENGEKYFGKEIFLELLEFDYSENIVTFELEKIFIKIINISDFFVKYLIFLIEKYLKKDEDFDEIYYELYDYYCSGFDFLFIFKDFIWASEIGKEIDKNDDIVVEIQKLAPNLLLDLKSGKYYNIDFDDGSDRERYKILKASILSPFSHRFTYKEKN